MKKRISLQLMGFYGVLLALAVFNSGCSAGSSSLPSLSAPSTALPPTLDGTSDGTTDHTQFYVGVTTNSEVASHVHEISNFNSKCSISPATAHADITCYVDVPEADLFMNGITLKYNVPSGMCRYLRRSTYWYYNNEVGVGPSNVVLDITKNASGDTTGYTCTVDGATGCVTSPTQKEVNVNQTTSVPTCIYDKSAGGGKNCCMGKYNLTINTTVGANPPLTQTTTNNWGGDVKSCLGGAGATNWTAYASGIPTSLTESTKYGVASEYKINAPIETSAYPSNISVANYYNPALHGHTGFHTVASSSLPYYMAPIDDRSGSLIASGNDGYVFSCLDEAFEVKHRIKMYIREWDTYPDFLNFVASAGVTSVPDRGLTSVEGVTCDGISGYCNDLIDADDFVDNLPGSIYNMSSDLTRGTYFPEIPAN